MKIISAHHGLLQTLSAEAPAALVRKGSYTEFPALDAIMPGQCVASGAVHELLTDDPDESPLFAAVMLAQASIREGGFIVWSDLQQKLYPPSLADAGISLDRLIVLRPKNRSDELRAIGECLRCEGVRATVAVLGKMTAVQARQLQLAAECGGGIGLLLRPVGNESAIYAAATRWKVSPLACEESAQRWRMELIHGHGGRVGESVVLEVSRENIGQKNHVRVFPFVEYSAHQTSAGEKKRQSA